MKKSKKIRIIIDKIPFSCLGESDGMVRDEGERGKREQGGGAAVQNEKKN